MIHTPLQAEGHTPMAAGLLGGADRCVRASPKSKHLDQIPDSHQEDTGTTSDEI